MSKNNGKPEDKTVKKVATKRSLSCKLTDQEVLKYSREMSECIQDKQEKEGSLASFSAQAKAKIKEIEGKLDLLSRKVNEGRPQFKHKGRSWKITKIAIFAGFPKSTTRLRIQSIRLPDIGQNAIFALKL